jgi:hypothetical protein
MTVGRVGTRGIKGVSSECGKVLIVREAFECLSVLGFEVGRGRCWSRGRRETKQVAMQVANNKNEEAHSVG